LSFEAEERGDDPEAEKELLSALNSDHTYKSRWALANFYFRHNQEDRFWNAAKEALEWAPRDTDAIFDLCWRLNPDPAFIAGRVLNSRPTVLRDYLNFLQMHKMAAQAYPVASRLLALNDVSDAPRLISYINSAIPTDDWAHGVQIWNQLSQKGWISLPALSLDSPQISNGDFRVPITGVGFDWRKGSCPGVYYEQDTAASRLVVEFSGDQPERCLILEQFVPTLNGVSALRAEASPTLDANSGLSWVLSDLDGRGIQPSKEQSVLRLARIALVYAKGTPRTRGRFVIQNVRLARSYGMLDAVHSANGEIVDSDSARGGPQTPN
jgi:hypothetical protein